MTGDEAAERLPVPRLALDTGTSEAQVGARGRGAALSLVVRAEALTSVGVLGGRRQIKEAQLADLHSRVEKDRHGRSIRQLQGHVARETGINETSGGVGEKAQASKRRLTFQASRNVVAQGDQFVGCAQHEFAGVKDEGIIRPHIDAVCEVRLVGRGVDHRVAMVVKKPKKPIQAHVNTCGLNQRAIQRIQLDSSAIKACRNIAITEQHGAILAQFRPPIVPRRARWLTAKLPLVPTPNYEMLRAPILAWYELHRRELPMRASDVSPWGTLVFEVMSQQTPIPRVQPIWVRWMRLWPSPADFAAASPAEALVEWAHLGYPSRALRLRECAQVIVRDFGGSVPDSYEALLALPGIGPYTASALASFQFHERIPVLDTNIRRVFARVRDGVEFARRSAPSRAEYAAALDWLPENGADCARWNVAIMEFGALVCTQRSPKCQDCPLRKDCAWAKAGFPPAEVRPRGQSWKGTDRQARGRVMAALRTSPDGLSIDEALAAARLEGADPEQAPRVIEALISDGLVAEDSTTRRITLPRE